MPISTIGTSSISALGYGFKNRLINGSMGVWQRGTSFSSGYTTDRWFLSFGTATITQSTDVPSGFKYSMSVVGTGSPSMSQRIESVNCTDLVGQSVTVSFWAKQTTGAAASSIGLALYYPTATDNFASIVQIGSNMMFTGTTGWVQYTATFTNLPSGAANGLQCIVFSNPSSSTTTLFTGVQLEKGSVATNFDWRPYGTELALCQRYYYKLSSAEAGNNPYMTFGMGYVQNASTMRISIIPKVTMRAVPTTLDSSALGTFILAYAASETTNPSSIVFSGVMSNQNVVIELSKTNSFTAGAVASLMALNTYSAYIGFGAEL